MEELTLKRGETVSHSSCSCLSRVADVLLRKNFVSHVGALLASWREIEWRPSTSATSCRPSVPRARDHVLFERRICSTVSLESLNRLIRPPQDHRGEDSASGLTSVAATCDDGARQLCEVSKMPLMRLPGRSPAGRAYSRPHIGRGTAPASCGTQLRSTCAASRKSFLFTRIRSRQLFASLHNLRT